MLTESELMRFRPTVEALENIVPLSGDGEAFVGPPDWASPTYVFTPMSPMLLSDDSPDNTLQTAVINLVGDVADQLVSDALQSMIWWPVTTTPVTNP